MISEKSCFRKNKTFNYICKFKKDEKNIKFKIL